MKKVRCRFTAMFETVLEVPDEATPEDIGEELANADIPENEECKYVSDTFEPETDGDGNPEFEEVE